MCDNIGETLVLTLRIEIKSAIAQLFDERDELGSLEIARELSFDNILGLKLIEELCVELENEGVIGESLDLGV